MKNFLKKLATWFHDQVEKGKKSPCMFQDDIDFNDYAPPTESLINFQVIGNSSSGINSRF